MEIDYFLLKDRIEQIEARFIKDGWLTIYESDDGSMDDQSLVFCCIVYPRKMKSYKENREWIIEPGSEGKPSVIATNIKGKWKEKYYTYGEEGIEPFLFSRWFSHNSEHYIDVSEEFVLYFKLFEQGKDKQNRTYSFIDEVGDLEEVIRLVPRKVTIKLRYLLEYISVRKVHFAVCFDFMRMGPTRQKGFHDMDKDFKTEHYFFNHFMRVVPGVPNPMQSWIHGKVFIHPDPKKANRYHFSWEDKPQEKFITGYDANGNEILEDGKKENGKLLKLTYFKKEVLNKYYNEPLKYQVDGWHVKSRFFYLKIDNHHDDYVAVFLTELGSLPYKEQLHWKQYNIPPQRGMSRAYYNTMIEGKWAERSGTPDLFFKEKYSSFNEKWQNSFGWPFYKPLSKEDAHHFTSLHIPTTNNIKSFCEQILSLVKITIDSLNEEALARETVLEKGDRGITKLEKFLLQRGIQMPDMFAFLRSLYDLRSGFLAHRFSSSNKKVKQAINYFDLKGDNIVGVATNIFVKSIHTMNTLEKIFLDSSPDLTTDAS